MYPRLLRRVQAVLIDSVIWPIVLITSIATVSYVDLENHLLAAALAFLPALSFEPMLVSFTGGTIGHHYIGLRVCSVSSGKNINLAASYLRSLLKFLFGIPSLIFILTTRRHQAIHDLLSKSVVILRNPETIPSNEVLPERVKDTENYIYPSRLRRLFVTLLYFVAAIVALAFALYAVLSDSCIAGEGCDRVDSAIFFTFEVLLLISLFAIPSLGWSARLYGCRKKKIDY